MALAVFSVKKRKFRLPVYPKWSSAVSLLIVVAMVSSLSLTGCGGGAIPGIDNEPETGDISGDEINGIPAKGTYYFHPDHVGSISYLTDSEGKVVSRMNYTPYGEIIKSQSTGTGMYNKKYTGQVYDGEESGLMYYNARYYDPALGRFITADSVIPGASNTQAFNRYMYVVGNPVKYKDPGGHKWGKGTWGKICSTVAGAAVGATYGMLAGAAIGSAGGPVGAVVGGIIGTVVGGIAGGIAGYKAWNSETAKDTVRNGDWWGDKCDKVGSGNWWEEQWNDWGKTTACIIAITLLITAAIIIGVCGGGWIVLACVLAGTIIGGTKGKPLDQESWSNWSWEYATLGAAIGFGVGLTGQYVFSQGSCFSFFGGKLLYTIGIGTGNYQWYLAWGAITCGFFKKNTSNGTFGEEEF